MIMSIFVSYHSKDIEHVGFLDSENINNDSINEINNQYNEELIKSHKVENIVDNANNEDEMSFSQEVVSSSENENELSNDLKESIKSELLILNLVSKLLSL